MTVSFVDQVEVTLRGIDLEPMNTDVLIVKGLLLATSATALMTSYRRATGIASSPVASSSEQFNG